MSKLMDKLVKNCTVSGASVMSESSFFNSSSMVPTPLPILNIAFSGDINGGFTPGISVWCGESKTFKSAISLYCLKAYLDKYSDAVGIIYDTEYGITPSYIKSFGIDSSRVIHIPIDHIEQLKFDFSKKLESIEKGEHAFFLVDSIGLLSSKKEIDDTHDEKSTVDMTRAKSMRSLLRVITSSLVKKELPCFLVNHVYSEIGAMYPKTIIPGGTSVTYSSNAVFVVTKSQEKGSDGDLDGWKFTIGIHKSRYVKEKERLPFTVLYDGGIQKYSGILDIAMEGNFVQKPKSGWYSLVDQETGELGTKNFRAKDFETDVIAGELLKSKKFQEYVKSRFKLPMLEMDDNDNLVVTEDSEED
jgi:RecA/RadA recombinase